MGDSKTAIGLAADDGRADSNFIRTGLNFGLRVAVMQNSRTGPRYDRTVCYTEHPIYADEGQPVVDSYDQI